MENFASLKLHPQLNHALLTKGKRLRPTLAILSGQSVGGDMYKSTPLALAFELVHTATLIHDDIIDKEEYRRGVPSPYKKWKDKAILGGDVMFVKAISLLTKYGPSVMRIVCDTTMEVCDGQFMDVSLSLEACTEEDYFLKVKKKSAALFKAAAECGAIAGGGTKSEAKCLGVFGEFFGIAYQLNDDLHELISATDIPIDLRNGRVTLPYIHLYNNGDGLVKENLEGSFGRSKISPNSASGILAAMKENGSIKYCRDKLVENMEVARKGIMPIRDSKFKNFLLQMANFVLNPEDYTLKT